MSEFRKFFGQFSLGIQIGLGLGAVFFAACFVIAALLDKWWLNELLCIFGGVIGWFLGILGSPTTRVQSAGHGQNRRSVSSARARPVVLDHLLRGLAIHVRHTPDRPARNCA